MQMGGNKSFKEQSVNFTGVWRNPSSSSEFSDVFFHFKSGGYFAPLDDLNLIEVRGI
jgi:hypothetical protein